MSTRNASSLDSDSPDHFPDPTPGSRAHANANANNGPSEADTDPIPAHLPAANATLANDNDLPPARGLREGSAGGSNHGRSHGSSDMMAEAAAVTATGLSGSGLADPALQAPTPLRSDCSRPAQVPANESGADNRSPLSAVAMATSTRAIAGEREREKHKELGPLAAKPKVKVGDTCACACDANGPVDGMGWIRIGEVR
jgi:hypothetical protein